VSGPRLYPAGYYDDNLVLRVPALLWLILLYLVRHWLFLLLSFLPRVGDAMGYLRDIVEPLFLIADLFAAPVLYVALRRRPGSPRWMRWIWLRGRLLLGASALTYVCLWVVSFGIEQRWHFAALKGPLLVSLAFDLLVLFVLYTSPLIRDVFRDFPAEK
jgi:hypothetical protein